VAEGLILLEIGKIGWEPCPVKFATLRGGICRGLLCQIANLRLPWVLSIASISCLKINYYVEKEYFF